MRKILFLDQFSDLGGGQLCLLDVLAGAAAAGWSAEVAIPGAGPLAGRLARMGVPVHGLSLGSYGAGAKSLTDGLRFLRDTRVVVREIRALVEAIRPEVLYVNGPRLMPLAARAGVRVPVVFHAHNRLSGTSRSLVEAGVRKTGAAVIAASRYVWEEPGARVVYGGVAGPEGPLLRVRTRPAVGLIGRIEPQKGQREFVEAAARLPRDWRFVLCGEARAGDRRAAQYRDAVRRAARASVEFLGWRDDVYEVLAELDLLVVPSAAEGGVPRVLLEAFAAGTPVLARGAGAIPEVVQDGENGFLLAAARPEEMARRTAELMARPEALREAAARARRDWEGRFRVERYRREIWEAVEGFSRPQKTAAASSPTAAVQSSGSG